MPELILYKDGLEDDDPAVEDAIDLLNRAVGGERYTVEEGEPEIPLFTGTPPYVEVKSGLENNPVHSYNDLEDVLDLIEK